MSVQVKRRRFTVDEYERMALAGILSEDDRVELIEGEIVEMTPIGSRHADVVTRLTMLLARAVGDRALVSVQNPVRLDRYSEPQPDLTVLRPGSYAARHPEPSDVLLLIEVADATGRYDRGVKLPLYARAGVPEVWIVDLQAHAVEQYRAPAPDGYREVTRHRPGDRLAPEALPDLVVSVEAVL
ncbi:MAG: Uma2 family endonuclease [Armatimonadota bacterium]|nr:Uma2 family endonuclease [Armatimonadota bacterium]